MNTDREQVALSLDAWLGDARADLTDEQYTRLLDEAVALDERYPDPDDADDYQAALSATMQCILGETSPEDAGGRLRRARAEAHEAMVVAQTLARLAVLDGVSEVRAAALCGLDRMTVRKALGKR